MSGEAPDVKLTITAEDTSTAAAIKELVANLKTLKAQQQDTAEGTLSLKSAFDALVSSAVVLKLIQVGKAAVESAAGIDKLQAKTGVSTQTLSVFRKSADDLGISSESVDKGIIKLANTITKFEQGSGQAAKAFGVLGIQQKDFVGLNSDQKVLLVTNALGRMEAGTTKAALAQQLLSKGGAELIPVLNQLAGDGFDKATESARKLGLLIDQDLADSALVAEASLKELGDVGKGMATQFEAGLLPAITDVADAFADASVKGTNGFKAVGEVAGYVARGIAFGFIAIGSVVSLVVAEIVNSFDGMWDTIKTGGASVFNALGEAAKGNFTGAYRLLQDGVRDAGRVQQDSAARTKAIWDSTFSELSEKYKAIFPSADEEAKRQKERAAKLKGTQDQPEPDPRIVQPKLTGATDAQAALLQKQLQDELAIYRANAAQRAQADKISYEQGQLSLKQYYDRRRTELTEDTERETKLLTDARDAALAASKVASDSSKRAATPQEKDKLQADSIRQLEKVEELNTKIAELKVTAGTKQQGLDNEQFKAEDEHQKKVLDFQAQILASQGKTYEAAIAKINAEAQEVAIALKQAGLSPEEVARLTAQIQAAKTAAAGYEQQQKVGESALKDLADQRAEIEDKVKTGKLFQVQADEQVRQLELSRLSTLQAIADTTLAAAKATGDQSKIQQATDFQRQVAQIAAQADQAGQRVAQLKETLQSSLTSGFSTFFETVGRGTETVGQSFVKLAASVVQSLEKIAAQMLATLLVKKLLAGIGGGATGGAGSAFSFLHFSGGGLVPGRGSKDSVPAMLMPGEGVLTQKATSLLGADTIHALNKGFNLPDIQMPAVAHFSEGGIVGAAGSSGPTDMKLMLGLDEGLVLQHLSSKSARSIILNHVANAPKSFSKAIGRAT